MRLRLQDLVTYALRATPIGLGLVVLFFGQALLGRLMGPQLYGQYGLLITWIMVAAILSRAGHEWVLMRNLPPLIDRRDHGRMRYLILAALGGVGRRLGVAAAAVGLILLVLQDRPLAVIAICVAIVAVSAIAGLIRFVGLAYSAPWLAEFPENILRPLLIAGGVYVLLGQAGAPGLTAVLSVTLGASIAALSLAVGLLIAFKLRPLLRARTQVFAPEGGAGLARSVLGANAMNIILRNADVLMVGVFCSPAETGLYLAASRIAAIPTAVLTMLDPVMTPEISRASHASDKARMRQVVGLYCSLAGGANLVLLLAFLFGGGMLMSLTFGPAFADAALFSTVLVFGHFLTSLSGPLGSVLNLTGHHNITLGLTAVSAVVALALMLVLTVSFGALGAAIAFSIASAIKMLLQGGAYAWKVEGARFRFPHS